MNVNKKVLKNLNKCYSIAPLKYNGGDDILVAAEKQDPCYLFSNEGEYLDEIWDGPGGVMTMVQVPESNGQFLSTYKFYSPNDSKEAKIVTVTPQEDGSWDIETLVDLPHVHRFDILERNGQKYLIACTLKSGHEYKDDWRSPGKVYAAKLPDDLSEFNQDNQLELEVIKDNLLKNHGYYRINKDGVAEAIISSEDGVFEFIPPEDEDSDWTIKTLIEEPTSDAVLIDLNQDGVEELCTIESFHGDQISIYDQKDGVYEKVYEFPEKTPFLHAIGGYEINGIPTFVIGHRGGKQNLYAIRYNPESEEYTYEVIDEGRGPANVFYFNDDGVDKLVATNRETDEIAMYTLSE